MVCEFKEESGIGVKGLDGSSSTLKMVIDISKQWQSPLEEAGTIDSF